MYSIIFFIESVDFSTEGEARTPDTWFWRPVLYRLSYFRRNSQPRKRPAIVYIMRSD